MRKIFVSTLVLSIFIGSTSDIFAQRKRVSVITSRTGRAGNRGGSGTTSNSSSSSSSNTDMLGTTKRFKDNTYNYSDKLYYDNEYNLNTFLTGATSDYYYNNGSSSINEQLCFGPYMFINKNTEDSNYLEYVGIEKSEATRTCIDIMPNMTYTLGLIPASDEAIQDASAEGRYLTIQNNNFPSRDIKKLLTTEKYVDVSEHATNIINALNEVENNCSKYHENMDSIRKQLGTVLGTSITGTALSAGATTVNVLNVKKTEETGKKIANKENAQKQNDEILSKYQGLCPNDCDGKCSEEAKKTDNGKKAYIECVKGVMETDYNNKVCDEGSKEKFVNEYNAKREQIITLVIDKVKGWEKSSGECGNKAGEFTNLLGNNNFICKDREKQTNIWRTSVLGSKTQLTPNEEWCKNTWGGENKDENGNHQCVKMYAEWYLNKSGTFPKKITIDDIDTIYETDTVVTATVVGYLEDKALMDLKINSCNVDGSHNISPTNEKLSSTEIKAKINELDTYLSNLDIINDNKIAENMAASKGMDIANVALSGTSTLTSGVSIVFSAVAIAKVNEALENLEKCEKSLTELNSKFNEYNAEIEAEEGEY